MDIREKRLAFCEMAGSVAWFLMDGCWMFGMNTMAAIFTVPAMIWNVLVFRYIEPRPPAAAVTAAVNSWLIMNMFWMIGDVGKIPEFLKFAKLSFVVGCLCMGTALIRSRFLEEEVLWNILGRFRRFRIKF